MTVPKCVRGEGICLASDPARVAKVHKECEGCICQSSGCIKCVRGAFGDVEECIKCVRGVFCGVG